ncbi:hypothetical protein OF83DRAFT_1172060 [Amylostereum chailletii]|nr:hypothetical protein OF83DRAFT_1172060 [Amylostereum chailletii]
MCAYKDIVEARPACHHPKYYLHESMVVLRVGDTLYCARRGVLEQSKLIRDQLCAPNETDSTPPGTDDAHPIDIVGLSTSDFDAFIHYTYPEFQDPMSLALFDTWLTLLRVAEVLQSDTLVKSAVSKLDAMLLSADVRRLVLSCQYGITSWFVPACRDIVYSENVLSHEQASQLRPEVAVTLLRIQARYYGDVHVGSSSDLASLIRDEIALMKEFAPQSLAPTYLFTASVLRKEPV